MSKLDQLRSLREAKAIKVASASPQASVLAPVKWISRKEAEAIFPAKRGRPRIGETRDKPWLAAGMSRRTWYRRKAEAKR